MNPSDTRAPKAPTTSATHATQGIGTYFIALTAAWVAAGFVVVHASLPVNPIQLPAVPEAELAVLAPEGWKFFTRNPQEEQTLPLRRGPGGAWTSASENPNSRAANVFGLDRAGRAQGFELASLVGLVPKGGWSDCEGPAAACLERAAPVSVAQREFPGPTLCGSVGLVARPPVPWAWARSEVQPQMPARVVRLEVTC